MLQTNCIMFRPDPVSLVPAFLLSSTLHGINFILAGLGAGASLRRTRCLFLFHVYTSCFQLTVTAIKPPARTSITASPVIRWPRHEYLWATIKDMEAKIFVLNGLTLKSWSEQMPCVVISGSTLRTYGAKHQVGDAKRKVTRDAHSHTLRLEAALLVICLL